MHKLQAGRRGWTIQTNLFSLRRPTPISHSSRSQAVTTLVGTGGALTGSMLTTSLGTGALALAITPVLGDFGLLMALSVVYSFVSAIIALPPAIFPYAQVAGSPHIERIQLLVRSMLGV